MKILFLVYHGFDPASGITKKIHAQIKGLRQNGHEVHVCTYDHGENGHMCRFIDNVAIEDYGTGTCAAIRQRVSYGSIYKYCIEQNVDLVYARSYMNATPPLTRFFRKLRKAGVKSVMEIPTYPYDQEYKGYDWNQQVRLCIDKLCRHALARQFDRIITFSDEERIFGTETIRISNGIDLDEIPLHKTGQDCSREVHIVAVAEVHTWHGFDRFIYGLGEYYQKYGGKPQRDVVFHIVGQVWPSLMNGTAQAPGFAPYINKYGIADKVVFHGKLFGRELDAVFDKCVFAVGSLARHRSGITVIKTLKNREYACRGIPFVYSEYDADFEKQPYIMKVPADETPVNIEDILHFIDGFDMAPIEIRKTVEHLSWRLQMKEVLDRLYS